MKRRLLMLRHAKSDWSAGSGEDHDRPLAPRGRRAARQVGRYLAAVGRTPDLVVSSSAVRALSTVELASMAGDWKAPVEVTAELYENGPEGVLEVLRRQASEHRTLLFAGHEPTWSSLVARMIGGARLHFPTAAVASIRFRIDSWQEAGAENGELELLITPRNLAPMETDRE